MDKITLFSKVEGDKVRFGIEHIGKITVFAKDRNELKFKSMEQILKEGLRKWEVQEVFYYFVPWYENTEFDFNYEWKILDDMMEQVIETVKKARKALSENLDKYNEFHTYEF